MVAPGLLLSVGPLFAGGAHFSTGSVIGCPASDLILTAAHSLTGKNPADVTFVPGYGVTDAAPVFQITQVFFPPLWLPERNIDNDFALARVSPALTPLEPLTIAVGWRQAQPTVAVPSYPDAMNTQLVGEGTTEAFGASQRSGLDDASAGVRPVATMIDG
jgi:trypsin